MVVWKTAGFNMIILLTGLQGISPEVQEAARMDGASSWQRFRRITLPLMRRTIALALILSVAGSMLAFDQFYIIADGGPRNRTVTAVYWIFSQSFVSFRLGYGAALSMVLLVILRRRSASSSCGCCASRRACDGAHATGRAAPQRLLGAASRYHAIGLVAAFLFLAPLAWSVLVSFKPPAEARQPPLPPWPVDGFSLESYENLEQFGVGIWTYAGNSLTVSAGDRRR